MRITGARWSGGELILLTKDPEAIRFAMGFKEGDYTIAKAKKPRSLDANSYSWVLIDKLAAAMHMSKLEIYRNAIRDTGGTSDTLCMVVEAYQDFKRHWESRGDGWQCTAVGSSKIPGCVVVTAYYGSSAFDTEQMSALIDNLIQDCKALDIETMPPDKLQGLLEAWDAR